MANIPSFYVSFDQLGSGINLTPQIGGVAPTFTRATPAYTRLASGIWQQVNSGVARSYYSDTGVYLGYLAEGARTNLCLQSNDFTQAAWTLSNMTAALTATGPDGLVSASTLTATADNATALQAITNGSASRIASMFIKRRTGSGVINITQDNGSTWTAVTVTSGWTQVSSTNQTLTNPTVGVRIVTNGDAVDVWCFMNEVGTFASTPIPTTSATVARNADVLTYPTTGWFTNSQGVLLSRYRLLGVVNRPDRSYLIGMDDAGNDRLAVRGATEASTTPTAAVGLGGSVAGLTGNTITVDTDVQLALAYGANLALAQNGALPATNAGTSAVNAAIATMFVGSSEGSANQLFGPIRFVAFYRTREPNAELQRMATVGFVPSVVSRAGVAAKNVNLRFVVEHEGVTRYFPTQAQAMAFLKSKADVAIKRAKSRGLTKVDTSFTPIPRTPVPEVSPIPEFIARGGPELEGMASAINFYLVSAFSNPEEDDDEDISRLLAA